MRVIGVMDLMGGIVVRGVGGRRQKYRPVVSTLTPSCQPLPIARTFRDRLGLTELYIADLDAIAGGPAAHAAYRELHEDGFELWIDAGARTAADAVALAQRGAQTVVAGLETIASPSELCEAARALGKRLVFSVDLRNGCPLKPLGGAANGAAIAEQAIALGARRVLVLDLARVGIGAGTGTEALCIRLAAEHPDIELSSGGGVRGRADLERLQAVGVHAALVASALHDGTLTRDDLTGLGGP